MARFLAKLMQHLHPHQRGRLAETLAHVLYASRGYTLVRFHGKHSLPLPVQVDLLYRRGTTLVLVEVKYRQSAVFQPFSVHPAQQQRLIRAAQMLLGRLSWVQATRIDVVLIGPAWPFIRYLPGAILG